MSEAQTLETDSLSHQRNAARVAKDEAELNKLLKEAGVLDEDSDDSVQQEAAEEASQEEPEAEAAEEASEPVKTEEVETEDKADEELSAEEKTFKQRYGDLRKHMQQKDKEYKERLEKLEEQLNKATKNELVLPKSAEEVEAWAKKYPDVAGIVEAIADKKAAERAGELDSRLQEIEQMRTQAKKEKAEAELMKLHPDFAEIRADDAFHQWAEKQPKVVQDALYDNIEDVKSVARVLDLYKVDKGITNKKKSTPDKAAASSVKSTKTKVDPDDSSSYLRESQVAKMSMKEYEKRMDEIFEAQRNGKFIYDISKK
jgi:hypothetical protein